MTDVASPRPETDGVGVSGKLQIALGASLVSLFAMFFLPWVSIVDFEFGNDSAWIRIDQLSAYTDRWETTAALGAAAMHALTALLAAASLKNKQGARSVRTVMLFTGALTFFGLWAMVREFFSLFMENLGAGPVVFAAGSAVLMVVGLLGTWPDAKREPPAAPSDAERDPGLTTNDRRPCPYCAEQIQQAAIICRFCGRNVAADTHP